MSNLGGYQKLTTFAKKVGGPGNLVVLIAGSGVAVGAEGRIACQKGKELNVVSADDFIQDHNDGESQLYTVYLMGDSAELILATDPADVETK